jgi:hypothetical protein
VKKEDSTGAKMHELVSSQPVDPTFEQALLRGEASGYAICVKPLRFAKLPNTIATAFAEIGEAHCYYVFELESEARAQMERIPPQERLGCILSIESIRYIPEWGPQNGPRFDATGHPSRMRGFVVDRFGAITEWKHAGRLGWHDPEPVRDTPSEATRSLRK